MKKWCFLLAALLLLPLSACRSSETLDRFYGRVEEVQRGPDGALSALVLQNEEGVREGILLTEETHVVSAVEEVLTEAQFLEQTPLGTEVSGYFLEDVPGQTLSAQDGSEYSARTAHLLVVEEAKRPEGCTLSDGTQVEVWWDGGHNTYRLPDGTELLWEDPPETNFSTYYVEGEIPLTALPPALLEGITACYQERGALYDIQEEVERAYQAYRQSEDPEQFSYFLVEQRVGWAATAPGVYYFHTTVILPVQEQEITEHQFTDAFDRETGEHIPNEELFTVSQSGVVDALIAQMGVDQTLERELRENFQWSYLSFGREELYVWYPEGSLPSQEHAWGWGFRYEDLSQILQPWAVPEAPEQ